MGSGGREYDRRGGRNVGREGGREGERGRESERESERRRMDAYRFDGIGCGGVGIDFFHHFDTCSDNFLAFM